ncbi:MAG: AMP-binding protein [Gammaproteobacteria bacterium]|nr:AMP-binding protein [Gammaproteobacteria bacterium]
MNINPADFQHDRISDYLYRHAANSPDKEAACDGEHSLSYSALLCEVETCAKSLIALGVEKGDRVATLSPPHSDYLIIFLATTAIGGIWLGLNPRYTRDELEHVISDSEPKVIFARSQVDKRQYDEDLQYFQNGIESIQDIVILQSGLPYHGALSYADFLLKSDAVSHQQYQDRREDVNSLDAAMLVYTSGTTGKPKGAILHHYGAIRHSHVQRALRSNSYVRLINVYPINHIAGAIACTTYCLVVGGTNCFLEKFDPGIELKMIEEKRITVWGGVPIMLQSVLDHPDFSSTDFSSVNEVSYSGGSTSLDLLRRITDEVCPRITTMYALTEAAGTATAIASTNDIELLASSVGKPVSDCEFRLVDENNNEVNQGEKGEIQIRGPFIMKGYWRLPEATKEAIDEEGWLHTKDVAIERDDGNIVLVGRLSDMYKSGGYNIYPREIEQVLEAYPAVSLACVVGVPDPTYHEVGYAFVTLAPGQTVEEQSLLEHCHQHLANYKVPKIIKIEERLPLLPNNKPDKRKLQEIAGNAITPVNKQSVSSNLT